MPGSASQREPQKPDHTPLTCSGETPRTNAPYCSSPIDLISTSTPDTPSLQYHTCFACQDNIKISLQRADCQNESPIWSIRDASKKLYHIAKVYKKQGKSKEKVARKSETCYNQCHYESKVSVFRNF